MSTCNQCFFCLLTFFYLSSTPWHVTLVVQVSSWFWVPKIAGVEFLGESLVSCLPCSCSSLRPQPSMEHLKSRWCLGRACNTKERAAKVDGCLSRRGSVEGKKIRRSLW